MQPSKVSAWSAVSSGRDTKRGISAATRATSALCERIVVGQGDEIAMMRQWLRDRDQVVPEATSTRHKMKMNGMEHEMLMPGMMTDEQMAALEKARGPEFDRLFLEGMIRHHQGAITTAQTEINSGKHPDAITLARDIADSQQKEVDAMTELLNKI